MTDMIQLNKAVVNPSHIEEAYLQESSTSTGSGHYLKVGDTYYACPTKTGVVVHYATGRTCVYGGDNANTLWLALYGIAAYVDTEDCPILQRDSLKVKVRGNEGSYSYDWVEIPPQLSHDELAEELLRLLWIHNYVDTDTIGNIDEGTHKAVFMQEGVGIMPRGGKFRDAVIVMPCSYRTN